MSLLFLQRVFLISLLLLLRRELSDAAGGWLCLGSWEQQTWERRKQDMGCQEKYISVALICRFSTHFVHFRRERKANQNAKQRQMLNSVSENSILFTSNCLCEFQPSMKLYTFNHDLSDDGAVYGRITVLSISEVAYFQWHAKCSSWFGLFIV